MILVADIGGTHTRVALADGAGTLTRHETHPTPEQGIEPLLLRYLDRCAVTPERVALGVAGRVKGSTVALTNHPLRLDADTLAAALRCAVSVHHDLEAVAWSLPLLEASALDPLGGPPPVDAAPRLAVAIGTGFGAALLTPGGEAIATEAGHVALPPSSAALLGAHAAHHPTIESLFSGAGVTAFRARAADPDAALATMLGQVCAMLALATGAWGGVYLTGGVIAALGPRLDHAHLRSALPDDGPFARDLATLPVVRILDPHAALRGLAHRAAGHR